MGDFQQDNPIRMANTAALQSNSTSTGTKHITLRKKQRHYQKPSLEKALKYKLALHPSYIPNGMGPADRRLFPCCTPTGRFCGKRTSCCDCCSEGRISTWTAFGSGVTAYFKNLKWLTLTFFLVTVCFLPAVIINSYGNGNDTAVAAMKMSATTLANLAQVNGTGYLNLPYGQKLEKRYIGLVYSLCDLAGCLILLISWIWLRYFEVVEDHQVDKDTTTADDYTVYLPWVPPQTTEDDIRAWVKNLTAVGGNSEGFAIADINLVEDQMDVVSTYVARGRIFRQIERIGEKIARLEDRIRMGFTGCTPCCGGVPGEVLRLKKFRDVLAGRASKLSDKAKLRSTGGMVAAFVTFQQQDAAAWMLTEFPQTGASWLCQPRRRRLLDRRIRVLRAPAPSSVIWANLNITSPSQMIRQFFTGTLTALLLVGSFILLWFASWKQQEFQNAGPASHCGDTDIVNAILTNQINSTNVLNYPIDEPLSYCWCATQSWKDASRLQIINNPFSKQCPHMACPQYFNIDPFGTSNLDYCVRWVRDRSITIGLTVAASVSIIAINSILTIFMRILTSIEGHHSFDDLNASLSLRLFFAQFFNTGVLMVIINASANELFPVRFKTGKYDDFTVGWYENVGASLMTTMIINIFTPHAYPVITSLGYYCTIRDKKIADKAPSQRDLNESFIGPYMDYAARYASLYNILFVTFVFATGIPLMVPISVISFFIAYWIDKMLFMWYFRRPPNFGISLQRTMSNLVPVALISHLAVGTWMISNITIFDDMLDPLSVRVYIGLANRLFDKYVNTSAVQTGMNRVTQLQALPLLVLLALIVVIFILRLVFLSFKRFIKGTFNLITCGYCTHIDFNWDKDDLVYVPTYKEATDIKNVGTKLIIHGIPSYNMLMNPEIQAAFAITPEFARKHKRLADLAHYRVGSLKDVRNALTHSTRDINQKSPEASSHHLQTDNNNNNTHQIGTDSSTSVSNEQIPDITTYQPTQQESLQHPQSIQSQQTVYNDQQMYDPNNNYGYPTQGAYYGMDASAYDAVDQYNDAMLAELNALNYADIDEEDGVDDEVGGYLAGYPPAQTASSRYLRVTPPEPNGHMSMMNLYQNGVLNPSYQPPLGRGTRKLLPPNPLNFIHNHPASLSPHQSVAPQQQLPPPMMPTTYPQSVPPMMATSPGNNNYMNNPSFIVNSPPPPPNTYLVHNPSVGPTYMDPNSMPMMMPPNPSYSQPMSYGDPSSNLVAAIQNAVTDAHVQLGYGQQLPPQQVPPQQISTGMMYGAPPPPPPPVSNNGVIWVSDV